MKLKSNDRVRIYTNDSMGNPVIQKETVKVQLEQYVETKEGGFYHKKQCRKIKTAN